MEYRKKKEMEYRQISKERRVFTIRCKRKIVSDIVLRKLLLKLLNVTKTEEN